ncbi:hypothetical protein J2T13_004087 [Paenibacillus sp. DS2015]
MLETLFTAVLQFLVEEKYVSLEHYFLDRLKPQNKPKLRGLSAKGTLHEGSRKSGY